MECLRVMVGGFIGASFRSPVERSSSRDGPVPVPVPVAVPVGLFSRQLCGTHWKGLAGFSPLLGCRRCCHARRPNCGAREWSSGCTTATTTTKTTTTTTTTTTAANTIQARRHTSSPTCRSRRLDPSAPAPAPALAPAPEPRRSSPTRPTTPLSPLTGSGLGYPAATNRRCPLRPPVADPPGSFSPEAAKSR